jgi:CheY-like chemotaxis protein
MGVAMPMALSPAADEELCPQIVLIVDDDVALREGLAELIEHEGYATATATDGLDALAQLRQGLRPCAILLDLMMPKMDGWDFRTEQLKEDDLKDIPVIVMTAAGFSVESMKTQFGELDFLSKPAPHDALLDAIRRCCGEPG